MKTVRYGPPGRERPGLVAPDGALRELGDVVADLAGDALDPERLAALAAYVARDWSHLPRVAAPVRLGPCVGRVGKIVCAGLNYESLAAQGFARPAAPVLFLKAGSAVCGPDDALDLPPDTNAVDWEVELAVVIGRRARRVAAADALAHVAGYCVFNDVSARDWQFGDSKDHNGGQWDLGKNHDGFAPLGPWLVTPDEIADPRALRLSLAIDGETLQDATTADLIFDVPALIEAASARMTLEPGDVIATGTPPGCSFLRSPPRYLQPGQTMVATISGLGTQTRRVRAAGPT